MKLNSHYLITAFVATVLLFASCNSVKHPSDLSINGWVLRGANPEAYQAGIDRSVTHLSTASAFIASIAKDSDTWTTLMQEVKPNMYKGKRVRFSAWVKTEKVTEWGGLWMRVDKGQKSLAFDNMQDRPIKGTTDWQQYEVVLNIDTSSTAIAFGLLLVGPGKTWIDNVKIETVDTNVPVTGFVNPVKRSMSNLSFEKISSDSTPIGWAGTVKSNGYRITSDRSVFHDSLASARLESDGKEGKSTYDFGTITGGMKPDNFLGKRVRMTGWIKTENVAGWAGLWMRVDGQNDDVLSFDNMNDGKNRSIKGTTDWTKYDVVLDVPKEATNINFGALLSGDGKIWLDEVKFEVVGNDVPSTSTYNSKIESALDEKQQADVPSPPRTKIINDSLVNPNFEN